MRVNTSIFLALFILTGRQAKSANDFAERTDTVTKIVAVHVLPVRPLIEKDAYGQYLNFDLAVKNTSGHVLELNAVEVSVLNRSGKLVLRKSLNHNGQAPGIALLGNTTLKPGEVKSIFNPFFSFVPNVDIKTLSYQFFFNYADNPTQVKRNENRLPMDYDESFTTVVSPSPYLPKTLLQLPLKGKVIVWDGHDFYAHHRRYPLGLAKQTAKGITANSNRFAYDFITIDAQGNVFKGTPFKKEDWYTFGKPVYAPGSGRIVESQNNVPDNAFVGKDIHSPNIPESLDPLGMGNHVIIDHGNGEYSVLLHMEQGTVKFKAGDYVRAGQQIGTVGFSGDAIFPHVHYTVMNGPKEGVNEGVPSYFNAYKLYRGTRVYLVKRGRVDSGDILSSNN